MCQKLADDTILGVCSNRTICRQILQFNIRIWQRLVYTAGLLSIQSTFKEENFLLIDEEFNFFQKIFESMLLISNKDLEGKGSKINTLRITFLITQVLLDSNKCLSNGTKTV